MGKTHPVSPWILGSLRSLSEERFKPSQEIGTNGPCGVGWGRWMSLRWLHGLRSTWLRFDSSFYLAERGNDTRLKGLVDVWAETGLAYLVICPAPQQGIWRAKAKFLPCASIPQQDWCQNSLSRGLPQWAPPEASSKRTVRVLPRFGCSGQKGRGNLIRYLRQTGKWRFLGYFLLRKRFRSNRSNYFISLFYSYIHLFKKSVILLYSPVMII